MQDNKTWLWTIISTLLFIVGVWIFMFSFIKERIPELKEISFSEIFNNPELIITAKPFLVAPIIIFVIVIINIMVLIVKKVKAQKVREHIKDMRLWAIPKQEVVGTILSFTPYLYSLNSLGVNITAKDESWKIYKYTMPIKYSLLDIWWMIKSWNKWDIQKIIESKLKKWNTIKINVSVENSDYYYFEDIEI